MITLIPNSGGMADLDNALVEYNTCHAAGDGKFCSGSNTPDARGFSQGKYGTRAPTAMTGKATAASTARVRRQTLPATAASSARVRRQNLQVPPDARGFSQGKPGGARKAARAEIDAETKKYGPNYATTHRGVEIHTLPSYTTPYYYAKHPALGTFEHSRSLQRVKNQINDIIDRGMTPRKKASARYQKRKHGTWTRSPE